MDFRDRHAHAAPPQQQETEPGDASPHVERILAHHPHDAAAANAFEDEVRAILDTDAGPVNMAMPEGVLGQHREDRADSFEGGSGGPDGGDERT